MRIFDEDLYDELSAVEDRSVRIHKAASHMASLGIRLFPCVVFDEDLYERELAKYNEGKILAQQQGVKHTGRQRDYQQYGGKAPAFSGQYEKASCIQSDIDAWWKPYAGKYHGQNIGLATGSRSGIVVLDMDVKLNDDGSVAEDGFLWWNKVSAQHPEVRTMQVRTGGKSQRGLHMYFKFRDDIPAKSNKNKFAEGVDFRSDNGHVMAPLSQCYGTYEVIDFEPIADMPDWLFDAIFGSEPAPTAKTSDAEQSDFDVTPLDQVAEMLEYIDPADHEDWWQDICFAIKSEHDNEDGYHLLDTWSKRDPVEYDEAMNRDFWNRGRAKKENGANMATLYYFAESCGWINPKRGAIKVDVSRAVRMMNKAFAVIDPDAWVLRMIRVGKTPDRSKLPPVFVPAGTFFKTRYILNHEGKKYRHAYGKIAEVAPGQIGTLTSQYKVEIKTEKGKSMYKPVFEVWMSSPARNSYASAGFYINDSRCPEGVLNLFPGFKVTPKEGVPEMFLRHIREITCNGDETRALWLLNRLAYLVQYGDAICPTALAITGEQGSGKTIVSDYMRKVLGELNHKEMESAESLTTRFSEELIGKFFMCADEAIFAGDPKLRNKLKSMISAQTLRDEGKGTKVRDAQNVMFLMVLSNEEEPVSIEKGDRRFTVMKTNNKYSKLSREANPEVDKEARSYFKDLVNEMNGDGPSHLLHMLLNWDVDFEMARTSLSTNEKQNMAEVRVMKCDSLVAYMYHLYSTGYSVENHSDGNNTGEGWGGRTKTTTFYDAYVDWTTKSRHKNSEWKVETLVSVRNRLTNEFAAQMIKPSNKSYIKWPVAGVIHAKLATFIPNIMTSESVDEGGEDYDASKENDF